MANYRILSVIVLLIWSRDCLSSHQSIPDGYYQVAAQERVPAEALYSLALTESSKQLPHGLRPWPWSINVAGKSYRYASRKAAYQALLDFMRQHPLKRIDVGIAQINLGWNGHHFSSSWLAFDPYINLRVAAKILRMCYDKNPGNWLTATGCYHHPAGGAPAQVYQTRIKQHLDRLQPATATRNRSGVTP